MMAGADRVASPAGIYFVWGASVPLPPDLAPGWCYHPDSTDWLMVERLTDGSLWYVVCCGTDYALWPRVAVMDESIPGVTRRVYEADREAEIPLPVAPNVKAVAA